jgi:hypothetical protein
MTQTAQRAIVVGIAVGFAYQLALATAQIGACERQRSGLCEAEWAQGFAVSSGLLSTLLAYFIEAPHATATTRRRTTSVRSSETDPPTPPS